MSHVIFDPGDRVTVADGSLTGTVVTRYNDQALTVRWDGDERPNWVDARDLLPAPVPTGTRHVVSARFLFSDKGDADRAAALLDGESFTGMLAAEILIVEA